MQSLKARIANLKKQQGERASGLDALVEALELVMDELKETKEGMVCLMRSCPWDKNVNDACYPTSNAVPFREVEQGCKCILKVDQKLLR